VQKAGSSSISRLDVSSDKTKSVVDQSNEYTGPMDKQDFASPGGLVHLTKDGEGRVIQGSMDGTISGKQIVEQKDPNGSTKAALRETSSDASGTLGYQREVSGQLSQNYRERVENIGGFRFDGAASGLADNLVTGLTGDKDLGDSVGRIIGGTQGLVGDLRGMGVGANTKIVNGPQRRPQPAQPLPQGNPGTP
jgi:hypothetical protein